MENSRAAWLEERRSGIGGSDISQICGVSPYGSPLDIYLDKLGLSQPKVEIKAMQMGVRLEPVVAAMYEEATGKRLRTSPLVRHPEYPWVCGTPDRIIIGEDLGLEIKVTGGRLAHQWGAESDAVPVPALLQAQWYAFVTGLPAWDLAVLIAGEDFRIYHLTADPELHAQLFEIAHKFWFDNVLAQQPPPIDSSDAYANYLANKYRSHNEALVQAGPHAESWVVQLTQARATIREAEDQEQLASNNLKSLIGPHEGILGDGWKVTWKKTKDTLVTDWQELARALTPPPAMIARFTTTKEGSRRFLFTPNKESRNGK